MMQLLIVAVHITVSMGIKIIGTLTIEEAACVLRTERRTKQNQFSNGDKVCQLDRQMATHTAADQCDGFFCIE